MSRPADPNAKIDLLRAAEAVFAERGLDAAKVEEITARAGRSKGAFYLHFDSKEDCFRQIVETFLARLACNVDETARMLEGGADFESAAAYLAFWREKDAEIFEFVWQNRRVCRLLLEGGHSAGFGYLIDEFAERNRAKMKQFLQRGIQKGFYRVDLDVELASIVISGAYDRLARQLVKRERKPDLAALFGEMQRLLLGGIASPVVTQVIDSKVSNKRSKRSRA